MTEKGAKDDNEIDPLGKKIRNKKKNALRFESLLLTAVVRSDNKSALCSVRFGMDF